MNEKSEQAKSKVALENIKSVYFLPKIFEIMKKRRTLEIIKCNKKLQKLLNILFPQGIKKRNTGSLRSSHSSKIEQSFNTSVAVIDSKNKIQEYCLRKEFISLFYDTLKSLFNKFHELTNINKPKIGDKTILYSEFYYKIVLYKLEKPKNTRKKYFYPTLQSHITKQRLIDEEKRRIEEEMRRKRERQRYLRERELMDKEEKVNAFNDKIEEEEDESEEDIEEDLF